MRATVRHFHSPDVEDGNLDAFNPADREDLGVLVQMMVGPIDDELAHESFDVLVCTPPWLARWVREHGPTLGRHYLIVETWDWFLIRGFLLKEVQAPEMDTWDSLGQRIARIGYWEFEDYVDYTQ